MQIVVATASAGTSHALERATEIARTQNRRVRILRPEAREQVEGLLVLQAGPARLVDRLSGVAPERIAVKSDRPVLVVHRAVRRPYGEVVVCIDDRTDVERVLRTTRFVAPHASVSFLHAYEGAYEIALLLDGAGARRVQDYLREVRHEAWAEMSKKIAAAGGDDGALLLRRGSPQQAVLREERRRRARAPLFVLERRRSLVRHWIAGSVTRSLVRQGKSDVLVV